MSREIELPDAEILEESIAWEQDKELTDTERLVAVQALLVSSVKNQDLIMSSLTKIFVTLIFLTLTIVILLIGVLV